MSESVPRRRLLAGRLWWERSLGGHGLRRVRELNLDTHALALCAQQVLCTAPLLVAISAVMQRLYGHGVGVVMAAFFGLHGDSAADVEHLFGRSSASISTLTLLLGMITAIVFTTSVAAVQQRGFELIWTLPRRISVRSYLRQLLWTPALMIFSAGVLGAGRVGRYLDHEVPGIGPWAATILQALLTLLFYWWTQYWLLGGRVAWRSLLLGAASVAVLVTTMVRVSRYIVPGQISWQVHAYGLIGGIFVLSVWLMVLSAVIFGGVLFGALITQRRADPARGRHPVAHPLTLAGLESAVDEPDQVSAGP